MPPHPNSFLSNYYPSPFNKDNKYFLNIRQFIIYNKLKLFDSDNFILEKKILETTFIKEMNDYEKLIKNFDQKIWDEKKYEIIKSGLIEKFLQNEVLKKKLLLTKKSIIIESIPKNGNWITISDTVEKDFIGKNNNFLGKALMDVRTFMSEIFDLELDLDF